MKGVVRRPRLEKEIAKVPYLGTVATVWRIRPAIL